jgi:hypothetical protein
MQMQRAKARNFLLRTKMGHLATRWVLHITSILFLIHLMSHSVPQISHIQKHISRLGQGHWWIQLQLALQKERNRDKNAAQVRERRHVI